jgi:hypothetical protein
MKLEDYRINVRDRGQLLLVAAAVGFAGLFLIGLIGFALADLASYPSPLTADTGEIERYFRDNRDATRLNALVQLSATVPLLIYGAVAATRLRAMGDRSAAPAIAVAAGTLSAACLMLSATSQWALTRPHTLNAGGGLVRTLQDLAFMAGGPAHVSSLGVVVGAVSLAAWSTHSLPWWITALGGIVVILSGLSLLTVMFDDATWVLPIARFPSFLWLLATALALPTATAGIRPARAVPAPAEGATDVRQRQLQHQ